MHTIRKRIYEDVGGFEVFDQTILYVIPTMDGGWKTVDPFMRDDYLSQQFTMLDDALDFAVGYIDNHAALILKERNK